MKINLFIAAALATISVAFCAISFTACGTASTEKKNDVDTTRYEIATEEGTERDPEIQFDEEKNFDGKHYVISVHRVAVDSLPQVIDSNDVPFLDNAVTIKVTANGEKMFQRTFTKADFNLDGSKLNLNQLVLAGMAFSDINGSGIHFNAQLNTPGSEEGGNNFSITFPLSGGAPKIVAEEIAEDQSSVND